MKYLIIVLWLILGFIYFWFWNNGRKECCNGSGIVADSTTVMTDKSENTKKSLPLAFNWDKQNTVLGENFSAYKDSIVKSIGEKDILEITGYYRASEKNTTGEINLGIARAKEVRKLFPEIPDNRIRLLSELVDEKAGEKENIFESAGFRSAINTEQVKEIANSTLIYFPFNSTKKLNSKEIENYLDDIAAKVTKSGEIVSLTGHTDDIGSEVANLDLGKLRAGKIKNYLLSKGVKESQIKVDSKGESNPVVPNTSTENRAKNRRVELTLLTK